MLPEAHELHVKLHQIPYMLKNILLIKLIQIQWPVKFSKGFHSNQNTQRGSDHSVTCSSLSGPDMWHLPKLQNCSITTLVTVWTVCTVAAGVYLQRSSWWSCFSLLRTAGTPMSPAGPRRCSWLVCPPTTLRPKAGAHTPAHRAASSSTNQPTSPASASYVKTT